MDAQQQQQSQQQETPRRKSTFLSLAPTLSAIWTQPQTTQQVVVPASPTDESSVPTTPELDAAAPSSQDQPRSTSVSSEIVPSPVSRFLRNFHF